MGDPLDEAQSEHVHQADALLLSPASGTVARASERHCDYARSGLAVAAGVVEESQRLPVSLRS
jgi:hypothetical protein